MTRFWPRWTPNPRWYPHIASEISRMSSSSLNGNANGNANGGAGDAGAFRIHTVAVIGAGNQGRAFALRCAQAGFSTILEDVMPARLRRAREELDGLPVPAAGAPLRFALTVEEAVRGADVAIDFVPDELESKLEIFSLLDRMAPPKTILCTPTNVLSISDLASCTYRADRCVAVRAAGDLLETPVLLVPAMGVGQPVLNAVRMWLEAMGMAISAGQDLRAV